MTSNGSTTLEMRHEQIRLFCRTWRQCSTWTCSLDWHWFLKRVNIRITAGLFTRRPSVRMCTIYSHLHQRAPVVKKEQKPEAPEPNRNPPSLLTSNYQYLPCVSILDSKHLGQGVVGRGVASKNFSCSWAKDVPGAQGAHLSSKNEFLSQRFGAQAIGARANLSLKDTQILNPKP